MENLGITLVQIIALTGIIVLGVGLIVDLEMFYYVLTQNYASSNGEFLPIPSSGGHPLLAHTFGGIIGFILGIYYTRFSNG